MLAAGEGRRFGEPKAPVVVNGKRMVDRAVDVLRDAGCEPVIVVLGAWQGYVPHAETVFNRNWPSGMGSSLRVGMKSAQTYDVDAALVTLVDLPGLTTAAARRRLDSGASLAAATSDGQRGLPVLFARERLDGVAESAVGDQGARDYLRAHADDLILIEVGDVASGDDMDEPQ